jgi:methionyl-tRNA synthetase
LLTKYSNTLFTHQKSLITIFALMSEPKRYTITAALPYANGPLHIGHLAGAYIAADIYARYLRLQGKDVIFVCGSDEHGAAITIKAKKKIPHQRNCR